jgi:hypothetical protein
LADVVAAGAGAAVAVVLTSAADIRACRPSDADVVLAIAGATLTRIGATFGHGTASTALPAPVVGHGIARAAPLTRFIALPGATAPALR